jgi:hypothetical protein
MNLLKAVYLVASRVQAQLSTCVYLHPTIFDIKL